ncbi:MAG: biotin synthase BioB [Desulfobacterota bacterium]|nr:biotin synthase BioB [Thermodesulfobacteriota bacterium]MDW8002097.1 biotin synthase BioB [Deltaproteobacteria bacterium]
MDSLLLLKKKALEKKDLTLDDGLVLYEEGKKNPYLLIAYAREITHHFKGDSFELCMIVNAKSGLCPEDCKFCAQSVHYSSPIDVYPLIDKERIVEKAKEALKEGAFFFSIVTSGPTIERDDEWETILSSITEISKLGIKPCASLGMIDKTRAEALKKAGLFRYHHNLETSREYFREICSTHTYDDKLKTIKDVKSAGLSVCSGGIIGMGETIIDRIKLAIELRELGVDSVPINILNPRPFTPLANVPPISAFDVILTIAIFRFMLPDKDIRLCAGKELRLRQLLPLAVASGLNAMMTGNYLTTRGRNPALDKELIEDLGLRLKNTFLE